MNFLCTTPGGVARSANLQELPLGKIFPAMAPTRHTTHKLRRTANKKSLVVTRVLQTLFPSQLFTYSELLFIHQQLMGQTQCLRRVNPYLRSSCHPAYVYDLGVALLAPEYKYGIPFNEGAINTN